MQHPQYGRYGTSPDRLVRAGPVTVVGTINDGRLRHLGADPSGDRSGRVATETLLPAEDSASDQTSLSRLSDERGIIKPRRAAGAPPLGRAFGRRTADHTDHAQGADPAVPAMRAVVRPRRDRNAPTAPQPRFQYFVTPSGVVQGNHMWFPRVLSCALHRGWSRAPCSVPSNHQALLPNAVVRQPALPPAPRQLSGFGRAGKERARPARQLLPAREQQQQQQLQRQE